MKMNSDGVSVAGCKYIYAPKGQAGEYAPLAANPYRGCGHGCAYCYVPNIPGQPDRKTFDANALPRASYIDLLRRDAAKYKAMNVQAQVFLSFTSDVYNPFDTSLTRPSIEAIQDGGLGVCVLTKGGMRATVDADLFRPKHDAFAATLTSLDDAFSLKWERRAALPSDRIKALKLFHDRGIFTWVSLEPTLDVESSLAIVRACNPFVDLWKVGRVNYLPMTKTTDWRDYTHRMIDLLQSMGAAHYIKQDLQPFLPPGYHNPLRVTQHH